MTTGILPLETLKHLLNLNTGFFETNQYTEDNQMRVVSGDFDGAGISGGNLQYNFGPADRLQELFLFMLNNHDSVVRTAFGANTAEYTEFNNVIRTYTRAQRITWGAEKTDVATDPDKRTLFPPWETCLGNLLVTPECKAKYYQMRDAYYWGPPYDLFRQMSCKSRAALASLFDVYVNRGRFYPINLLQLDFEAIDADGTKTEAEKEAQKIYQINVRGNEEENGLNDTSSSYFQQRRMCQANQGGTYYGSTYDPETQFDVNQETAIAEKLGGYSVKLGSIDVQNVFLGNVEITDIYLGATLLGGGAGYSTSTVPDTQFRTNPNSYLGFESGSVSMTTGQPLWIDVQNFVACKTYYTIDGSTPTTASTLYTGPITFSNSCTLKALTVSIYGIAEAVKSCNITVAVAPTTTISPASTVQNSIPITITLSTSESGAAIKYKIGSSATVLDYTGPFTVNQNTAGVLSTNIKITYWSVGASATEAEKSITYDTSGALPAKSVLTATAGTGKVDLSWTASQNATAFTIYRSTTAGTLGTWIGPSQYLSTSVLSYSDTGLTAGTTYYYTIRAGNYGTPTDSDQKSAIPTAGTAKPTWRYIRIDGWGEYNAGTPNANFRPVGLEVWSGGTDRLNGKTGTSEGGVDFMAPAGFVATATNTVTWMTDHGGTVPSATTNYAGYWDALNANGNAFIKFDMGASYPIDSIKYWNYSNTGVQKAQRFRVYGTNNLANFGTAGALIGTAGVDYELLWDYSTNQTLFGLTPNHFVTKTF